MIKTLVIEDTQSDFEIFQEMAKSTYIDFSIDRADELEFGLELLKNKNYDIVFLDLQLPDSNGLETVEKVTAHIKKINKNTYTPIIALTGMNNISVAIECLKNGCKDYINKDQMDPKQLERAVRSATINKELPSRIISRKRRKL